MFFVVSKIVWFFAQPANILFFLVVSGAILLWTPWKRYARWLVTLAAAFAVFAVTIPAGAHFSLFIENRFPVPENMPAEVNGIIVLGGAVDQYVTKARGEISLGGSVERILRFSTLAQEFPDAKLVYTGGSGMVTRQEIKEADVVTPILQQLGIDTTRVIFENQSRNTYENALYSLELLQPEPDEKWILVTSATHMPRAVGSFRKVGWPGLIPYPTDFGFQGNESFGPPLYLTNGLGSLGAALHEILGLTSYYLTGKSDALIPAP